MNNNLITNNENTTETPILDRIKIKLLFSTIDSKPTSIFSIFDYLVYFINKIFYPLKESESISSIRFEFDPFSKKIYWMFVVFCLALVVYFYYYVFTNLVVVFFKIVFFVLSFILNILLKIFFGYKKGIKMDSNIFTLEQEKYICFSVFCWILMFVFLLSITTINSKSLKYNINFVIPNNL